MSNPKPYALNSKPTLSPELKSKSKLRDVYVAQGEGRSSQQTGSDLSFVLTEGDILPFCCNYKGLL